MRAGPLLTFEQFEALYDTDQPGKQELIDGEIVVRPPAELTHTEVCKRIYQLLLTTLHPSRVWPDGTGYRTARGWIEPDVSVSWPDQKQDDKYFLGSPMMAIEVLSPRESIERKLTLYFADGAAEVWAVDPKARALTVYQREGDRSMRIPISDAFECKIATGFQVRLTDIFE